MKFILINILLFSLFVELNHDEPSYYRSKLSSIASDFRNNIMDEDDCSKLKNEASDVVDDIERELKDGNELTGTEITQYKELLKLAKALEDYIGTIGGCENSFPTMEQFNLANGLVGGNVTITSSGKFCVDFISVTIGDYKVYLAQNNTSTNYRINYNWKAQGSMISGYGNAGVSAKSVIHIYDNREKPKQKVITIYGVTCKPFGEKSGLLIKY